MNYFRHRSFNDPRTVFFDNETPRALLVLNIIMALAYFVTIAFVFPSGHPVLFGLLVAGEVFHVFQVIAFIYTIWDTEHVSPSDPSYAPPVDVFITVAGEPEEVVAETAYAASRMQYPNFQVHILNDGYVAQKENWQSMELLAKRLGINCITRTEAGGAKAGNINHALWKTQAPLVAILDADHVPHPDFLSKTVPYLADQRVGFVQTPQYYKNFASTYVAQGAWDQQQLFFGPICKGKNRLNSTTMCGTNMVIRREALGDVGGMRTDSIAEDFVTGLLMHARGYRSVYVPEVLAEGLAPEDLLSYTKQQFRWARGALDVIVRYNPLFMRGLTMAQRIQYVSSSSFYLSGIVVTIDALLPVIFFYFGIIPLAVSGMLLAAVFLPYIFITLYVLQRSSGHTFSFRSLAFSMCAFNIHIAAFISALLRRDVAFSITPKERQTGNYVRLVWAHIAYGAIVGIGILFALVRYGFSASVINNTAWALVTVLVTLPYVQAALPQPQERPAEALEPRTVS